MGLDIGVMSALKRITASLVKAKKTLIVLNTLSLRLSSHSVAQPNLSQSLNRKKTIFKVMKKRNSISKKNKSFFKGLHHFNKSNKQLKNSNLAITHSSTKLKMRVDLRYSLKFIKFPQLL